MCGFGAGLGGQDGAKAAAWWALLLGKSEPEESEREARLVSPLVPALIPQVTALRGSHICENAAGTTVDSCMTN